MERPTRQPSRRFGAARPPDDLERQRHHCRKRLLEVRYWAYVEEARGLIEACGYHRRDKELELITNYEWA